MVEQTKKYLQDLLVRTSGLYCILITDREGVPLLKVATEKAPEMLTKVSFISTFGLAIDQGSKLGLGKTSTLICFYSQHQVIQMNKIPLVITFIASADANSGQILSLEKHLDSIVNELSVAVTET